MISPEQLNFFCLVWIGLALVLFPILFKVSQPYGMHSRSGWGIMISNKLGWFLMEVPALVVFLYFALRKGVVRDDFILIPLILWCIHYGHRALIYPLRIKTKGKKMPLLITSFGIVFNGINGFVNGYWLSIAGKELEVSSANEILRIVLGILLFISGFIINKYHDRLLIKLRKSVPQGYRIPYGGLFKYVSCPNYFGEIATWIGFFIVCYNLPALSFAIWTMVNLIPRAFDHHKWYKSHFENYPKERKVVIPYVL